MGQSLSNHAVQSRARILDRPGFFAVLYMVVLAGCSGWRTPSEESSLSSVRTARYDLFSDDRIVHVNADQGELVVVDEAGALLMLTRIDGALRTRRVCEIRRGVLSVVADGHQRLQVLDVGHNLFYLHYPSCEIEAIGVVAAPALAAMRCRAGPVDQTVVMTSSEFRYCDSSMQCVSHDVDVSGFRENRVSLVNGGCVPSVGGCCGWCWGPWSSMSCALASRDGLLVGSIERAFGAVDFGGGSSIGNGEGAHPQLIHVDNHCYATWSDTLVSLWCREHRR